MHYALHWGTVQLSCYLSNDSLAYLEPPRRSQTRGLETWRLDALERGSGRDFRAIRVSDSVRTAWKRLDDPWLRRSSALRRDGSDVNAYALSSAFPLDLDVPAMCMTGVLPGSATIGTEVYLERICVFRHHFSKPASRRAMNTERALPARQRGPNPRAPSDAWELPAGQEDMPGSAGDAATSTSPDEYLWSQRRLQVGSRSGEPERHLRRPVRHFVPPRNALALPEAGLETPTAHDSRHCPLQRQMTESSRADDEDSPETHCVRTAHSSEQQTRKWSQGARERNVGEENVPGSAEDAAPARPRSATDSR
ncbi:hypothetical protein C8T65DRAFT_703613 [Cerioporus squamosus]|nr:hypothetical protein C8T65DRAFT_703613 [Cerioporus squamosus]